MNERFTKIERKNDWSVVDNGIELYNYQAIRILNELNNENKELKRIIVNIFKAIQFLPVIHNELEEYKVSNETLLNDLNRFIQFVNDTPLEAEFFVKIMKDKYKEVL